MAEEIVGKMCISAAESIKRQCGREYGFADDDQKLRATDISILTTEELEGLPTNNCINERDLSKFDKEAYVSKCRNRKFKAKNIRNNMVLYKSKKARRLDRISKEIASVLADRERIILQKNSYRNLKCLKFTCLKASQSAQVCEYQIFAYISLWQE